MRYVRATVKNTCASCLVREIQPGRAPQIKSEDLYITGQVGDKKRALRAVRMKYETPERQILAVDNLMIKVQVFRMGINEFTEKAVKEKEFDFER